MALPDGYGTTAALELEYGAGATGLLEEAEAELYGTGATGLLEVITALELVYGTGATGVLELTGLVMVQPPGQLVMVRVVAFGAC